MHRWHYWMTKNSLKIDSYLRTISYRLLGFNEELLISGSPLHGALRSSFDNQLETALRFIYNLGVFVP